ncbi:hypothetical protein ABPG77_004232 [Micractinium sp. CCAP 211/92]
MRRRSPTPPARASAAEEPVRYVTWSRDNMELLLATFADMIKLVEVERLLIAYNARTPAIRRGDIPPLTVLQGLLAGFKYLQYHLGLVQRYNVRDGEDFLLLQAGDPVGEQAIQLISISNRNLLEAPDWEACGEGEVARLREMYLRRHGRGLPLNQAAEVAWRRSAALSWFALYRADEEGLAPHLHRLIEDLRDQRELRRMARRFDLEPEGREAGQRRADQAAGEQQQPPQQQQQEGADAQTQQPAASQLQNADEGHEREERRRREAREGEEAGRRQQRERHNDEEERRRREATARPRSAEPRVDSMAAAPASAAPIPRAAAASSELPPHLAHLAGQDLLQEQHQQQRGRASVERHSAQAAQPAASDLPPHLAPAASPALAPAFIPLGATPVRPRGEARVQSVPAQEEPTRNGIAGAAGGARELQAARQAAKAAAQRSRDSRPAAGARDRSASADSADPAASAAALEGGDAAAGSKRKRAAIQWEPQPQQEGDAPLQQLDSTGALVKPNKQHKAAAAAAAAAPAAAKSKPASQSAKAAAQSAKAAAQPAKSPKSFSITVRNVPGAREASPSVSEEGELRPAKAARQDAGPSRLAAAGAAYYPPASAAPDSSAFWQEGQQQQEYAATGAALAYPAAGQGQELAFPPGFGGDLPLPSGISAVGSGAGDVVSFQVLMPGSNLASHGGAMQQAPHAGSTVVPPGMPLGLVAGAGLAQPQTAALYGAGRLQPGSMGRFDDAHDAQVTLAAASMAPLPAAVFFAGASPTGQRHQQRDGFGGPGDLPAGFDGGGDFPPHLMAVAESPPGGSGPTRGGSGRLVQLEGGGGKGGSGRSGSGKGGDGRSGGDGGGGSSGGRSAAVLTGDACWDPMVAWEAKLIEVLRSSKGISLEDLHRLHPLPGFMPQKLGALKAYVAMRKQLSYVRQDRDGAPHRVYASRSAEAWLQYKRAVLQLLAERRPRLEAGIVQRQVALPSRLPEFYHKEAKHDFAAFIAKYFREEVQVLTHSHGPGPLLELRPFGAGAGGPGFPRLDPPFPRPCAAERCAHGEKCRFAHAQPRLY